MDPNENPTGNNPAATQTDNDADEWEQAGLDFLADKGIEKEDPEKKDSKEQETLDEQAKSQEKSEKEGEDKTPPEDKKQDEDPGDGDDAKKSSESEKKDEKPPADDDADDKKDAKDPEDPAPAEPEQPPATDPAAEERARRRAQLDLEADRKELAQDIKTKLFDDVPDKLLDAEGREIRTPEDVMQYRNPATGKNFTLEEGARWLQLAQKDLETKQNTAQGEVDKIVEVNLRVKEDADAVMAEFGEFLSKNPGLRKQIWADYSKSFKLSDDGEVIVEAPISMYNHYATLLQPYITDAKNRAKAAQDKVEADKKAEEEAAEAKKKAAEKKKEDRSDREDILSTRTKTHEGMDPEEKEWAEAAKEYYEG